MALRDSLLRIGRSLARTAVREGSREQRRRNGARTTSRTGGRRAGGRSTGSTQPAVQPRPYVGDFTGTSTATYAPRPDGLPDPGEVVWTWVPYEEDHSRGKDRPVLVVGRDGDHLLALMLTSKDHDRDAAAEARAGRRWLDLGAGEWDRQGRPSEVRLDRVLQVDPQAVRREGAVLDESRFGQVAARLRADLGWS